MKWLLTADHHINKNASIIGKTLGGKVYQHRLDVLDNIIEVANKSCDALALLGDIFDKEIPHPIETRDVQERLDKIKIPTVILAGNHEVEDPSGPTSQVSLKGRRDHIQVITKPEVIKYGKTSILWLPWNFTENIKVKDLPKADIMCSHFSIVDVPGAWGTKYHADDFKKFKRVFLGHFHGQVTIHNYLTYVGSPTCLRADEGDQTKGFVVYDTDTNKLAEIQTQSFQIKEVNLTTFKKIKKPGKWDVYVVKDKVNASEYAAVKELMKKHNLIKFKIDFKQDTRVTPKHSDVELIKEYFGSEELLSLHEDIVREAENA